MLQVDKIRADKIRADNSKLCVFAQLEYKKHLKWE